VVARAAHARRLGAVVLILTPPIGSAADWRVGGTTSQEVAALRSAEGDTDQDQLLSISSLALSALATDGIDTFTVAPRLSLRLTGGDRDDDQDVFDVTGGFTAGFVRAGPRLRLNLSLGATVEQADDQNLSLFFEPDPVTGEQRSVVSQEDSSTLQVTAQTGAGFDYALDPRQSVNGRVSYQQRSFLDDVETLDPFSRISADAGYRRSFSPRLSGTLSIGARRFMSDAEDASDTTSLTLSTGAGFSLGQAERLSLSVGVTGTDDGETVEPSFSGGASYGYEGDDTTLNLSLSQSVDQNDDGEVAQITAFRGAVGYRLTEQTRFSLGLGVSLETPIGGEAGDPDFLLAPSLQHSLAPDWTVAVGYQLRASSDTDMDNRVFARLSRSFSILD
jgi:hypothetical protein